jgi:lipid-A-disaccharide synthase
MPEKDSTYHIFISAAEPSADAHCAALITALKQSTYDIDFVGVGGPKMDAAGCKLLETTIAKAAMTYKAFSYIGYYYRLIRRISRFLKSNKVDLVIVCDSPAFNFHIAKAAKKANIKTLFYVAPQLWSWAGWRIHKLRKYCDKLCCILPFEQDWFSRRGIDTTFVGNPMLDELNPPLARYKKKYIDFNPKNAHFAIMPGSRAAEIDTLWVPMQTIAARLKQKYLNTTFTTVAADAEKQQALKAAQIPGFECKYTIGSVSNTAHAADFAIVASGSVTLQLAAVGCPMVIMYQSSKILWHLLGRWLLTTKHLSLVNILANKELVPEFMPYFGSIKPIVETIEPLLEDRDNLAQISSELIQLAEPLTEKKACREVAGIVVEMLRQASTAKSGLRQERLA